MIITIDGPSSSGKSTTARAVARRMEYLYLDTGAMYRAVALAFLRAEAPPTPEAAPAVLKEVRIDITYDEEGAMRVFLNQEEVTEAVRDETVGTMASRVSALRVVREKLVEEQRRLARHHETEHGGIVLDGRDTGTVVFPDAELKIFMVAAAEERVRRRHAEYTAQGHEVSVEDVYQEIKERDRRDRERALAPLRKAEDAIELDTTDRTIEEQVDFVVEQARRV